MVAQAEGFVALAPNIIVKFPTTAAGVEAMEEATARGISVNATVSFSVAQAIAAAEAVERGLARRAAAGASVDAMGPVITIMMGRLEDWLREVGRARRRHGRPRRAAMGRRRGLQARRGRVALRAGFRARLLGAAIRHHYHWSQLIGGDVVITLPAAWQRRFNASSVEVRSRIDDPVDPRHVRALCDAFDDFRRAYEPDGLAVDEFAAWGPSAKTLRAFIASLPRAAPPRRRGAPGVTPTAPDDLRLAPGVPVTPERAGWRYLSFRVETLTGAMSLGVPERETALVVLGGGGVRIGERELPGRASVWEGRASAAYLPAGCRVEVAPLGPSVERGDRGGAGGAESATSRSLIGPEEVTVEVRGAGNATRQINHIITPHFPARPPRAGRGLHAVRQLVVLAAAQARHR